MKALKRKTNTPRMDDSMRKQIMERLFRDNEEQIAAREQFSRTRDKLDWIREYYGQYGSEALAYDEKGNLFVFDGSNRTPVTLAESVEWSAEFESAGRLGIEADDNCQNVVNWMKQIALQLRACE